jgi:transcriptional regulator with XRE-family HTH domain
MNAAEARKQRGGSTLLERIKAADPARGARIDKLVAAASVEQIVQAIMDNERINAAELARRMNAKAPQISRDLHGGLSRATLSRLTTIANALGYDFIPAFVPRADSAKRKRFISLYRELIPPLLSAAAPPRRHITTAKKAQRKKDSGNPGRRRVA